MANSELSKIKILFIYDYFKSRISSSGGKEAVSVSELIAYLEENTGTTFERKSIYADIDKINEYVRLSGQTKDTDWIYTEGKKYKRSDLTGEILIDEARLIVDAISTTTFVDTEVCKKIISMFPEYFSPNYEQRILFPHDVKLSKKKTYQLNSIREAIEGKKTLKITYGYELGGELTEKSDKIISPMALDWNNNCYYVIAIDNAEAKKKDLDNDQSLSEALKRYRFDRIAGINDGGEKYIGYKNDKLRVQELRKFIENSVSAFSSKTPVTVELAIKGKSRKDALIAYSAFASRLHHEIKVKDDTKLEKGILEIFVTTGLAPTLYTALFELSTIENVEIEIRNEEICRKYAEHIKKAAKAAKLNKL